MDTRSRVETDGTVWPFAIKKPRRTSSSREYWPGDTSMNGVQAGIMIDAQSSPEFIEEDMFDNGTARQNKGF